MFLSLYLLVEALNFPKNRQRYGRRGPSAVHTVFVLMVVFFVRCEGLDGVVGPRMSPRLGNWMQRSTLRDRMSWRFARVVLVLPTFAETPNSLCDDRLDGLAAIPRGTPLKRVLVAFAYTSDLPVLGSVVFVVDADGVLDDDRVPAAEVVVEPLRVGWTQIGASVADIALALISD